MQRSIFLIINLILELMDTSKSLYIFVILDTK